MAEKNDKLFGYWCPYDMKFVEVSAEDLRPSAGSISPHSWVRCNGGCDHLFELKTEVKTYPEQVRKEQLRNLLDHYACMDDLAWRLKEEAVTMLLQELRQFGYLFTQVGLVAFQPSYDAWKSKLAKEFYEAFYLVTIEHHVGDDAHERVKEAVERPLRIYAAEDEAELHFIARALGARREIEKKEARA